MNFFRNNIYRIVSSVFYVVVGLLLIFTKLLLPVQNKSKLILGIVILAYGIFRAVSAILSAKKNED